MNLDLEELNRNRMLIKKSFECITESNSQLNEEGYNSR
jgi:hypothetical protein